MAAISNSLVSMRNPPAHFSTGNLFSHISFFLSRTICFFFPDSLILISHLCFLYNDLACVSWINWLWLKDLIFWSTWKIYFHSIFFSRYKFIMFSVLSFDPNNKLIIFVGFFSPLYVWICQFSEKARLMHDFLDGFAILES